MCDILFAFLHIIPSQKGIALKGKNLLPIGANSFLFGRPPFQKAGKSILTFASPENVFIVLIFYLPESSLSVLAAISFNLLLPPTTSSISCIWLK